MFSKTAAFVDTMQTLLYSNKGKEEQSVLLPDKLLSWLLIQTGK